LPPLTFVHAIVISLPSTYAVTEHNKYHVSSTCCRAHAHTRNRRAQSGFESGTIRIQVTCALPLHLTCSVVVLWLMSLNILTSIRLSRQDVDIHTDRDLYVYVPPDGRRSHSIYDGDIVFLSRNVLTSTEVKKRKGMQKISSPHP
jgi:hypothetical protein